ncbi:MAG: glycosyltransferase family 4 protein [Elusimicrobiota bacterium]
MKVAHIITRLDLGGAQQNTCHTARNLDPQRFDALLIYGPGGVLDAEAAVWPQPPRRIVVADLVREISPLRDLKALFALRRILHAERPDIVHTHSSKAGILGRLAAWSAGVPVRVHTFHGFGFHDRQPAWRKTLYVWAERLCARLSQALIFVSRDNQHYAQSHGIGDPARYHLIRSGVKLSELPARVDAAQKKKELGLAADSRLVLSVGNLKPQKNPMDFLHMARRVSAAVPDAAFVFVGDGPLRAPLAAAARALGARFVMPGWRRDVAELLAAADAFVLTSLWEGLPRALVEAMRSGLPAVCYATDGVKDLIKDGENGFTVAQGDTGLLARRVQTLLTDPGLSKRLGQAAAASIGLEFDIDNMVRQQEALYLSLLKP